MLVLLIASVVGLEVMADMWLMCGELVTQFVGCLACG